MAMTIVAAVFSALFLFLEITGATRWYWGEIWLVFFLLVSLQTAVLALRPRDGKDVSGLAQRLLVPLALAVFTEFFVAWSEEGFLPFLVLATTIYFLGVWGSLLLGGFLGLKELVSRLRMVLRIQPVSGTPTAATNRAGNASLWLTIRDYLDDWQLHREHGYVHKLARGERLEMVRALSLWADCYPAVIGQFFQSLFFGPMIGFGLAIVIFLVQVAANFNGYLRGQVIAFPWWLILLGPVIIGPPRLAWTYVVKRWEAERFRYVFFTGILEVVRARFNLMGATVFRSSSPTSMIGELKMFSPGENEGKENASWFGRQYDAFLLRFKGVLDIKIPSPFLGGVDVLEAVEFANGVKFAIEQIIARGKAASALADAVKKAFNDQKVKEMVAGGRAWGKKESEALMKAYEATVPLTDVTANLWDAPDPAFYDPVTGDPRDIPATSTQAASIFDAFPTQN